MEASHFKPAHDKFCQMNLKPLLVDFTYVARELAKLTLVKLVKLNWLTRLSPAEFLNVYSGLILKQEA